LGPALLWLWYRPEAIAPIRPLAWDPPYATGAALEKTKRKKKKSIKMRSHFATTSSVNVQEAYSLHGCGSGNRYPEVTSIKAVNSLWKRGPIALSF